MSWKAEEAFKLMKSSLALRYPFWYILLFYTPIYLNDDENVAIEVTDTALIYSTKYFEDDDWKNNIVADTIMSLYMLVSLYPLRKRRFIEKKGGDPNAKKAFNIASIIKAILETSFLDENSKRIQNLVPLMKAYGLNENDSVEQMAEKIYEDAGVMAEIAKAITYVGLGGVEKRLRINHEAPTLKDLRQLNEGDATLRQMLADKSLDEERLKMRMAEIVSSADIMAKSAGVEDSVGKRIIDFLVEPKKYDIYRRIKDVIMDDFKTQLVSYTKLNRKVPSLPGKISLGGGVLVLVDVSGSISREEYKRFCEAMMGLVLSGIEVRYISWDTNAVDNGIVRKISDLERKEVPGYGGTTPDCLADLLKKYKGRYKWLVMLTDGAWGSSKEFYRAARGYKKILITSGIEQPDFDYVYRVSAR